MSIFDSIYLSFQKKYPEILEAITSSCFVFIEEIILSENIDLQNPIDYTNIAYKDTLKKLAELIASGLLSINVPERNVKYYFSEHYHDIQASEGLITYVDWITNEFQPRVQKLIFREILSFILNRDSAITEFQTFDIVNSQHIDVLKRIRSNEPELNNFIYWYYRLSDLLLRKCDPNNLEPDMKSLTQFKNVERDIQSYYIGYKIAKFLELEKLMNLKELDTFLIGNQDWLIQNPSINEKYPLTLLCGVELAREFNISIPKDEIKNQLKKIIISVVNNYSCPAFQDTFLVYYILKSCEILDLKLTTKLIQGLTRATKAIITPEQIKSYPTSKLACIYAIFEKLDVFKSLENEIRVYFLDTLSQRKKKGLHFNTETDFVASCSAIHGAFKIYELEDEIRPFSIDKNIQYITEYLEDNISMFDLGLTGQISELYYGIEFLEDFLDYIRENQITKYSLYPLISEGFIEYKDEDIFSDDIEGEDLDVGEWEESEQYENVEIPETGSDLGMDSEISPDTGNEASEISASIDYEGPNSSRPLPKHYFDFFGDFPCLFPDVLDEVSINYSALQKSKEYLFEDLKTLHQFTVVLKILNIKFPYTGEEIFENTKGFRLENGFCRSDLKGDRRYPDPINTFYGLSIYSEFGILDDLNLDEINTYLLNEARNVDRYAILTNCFIFLSLNILQRRGYEVDNFSYLIPQIISIDYERRNDQFEMLEDMIYLLTLIRSISPEYKLSELSERYHLEVQVALEEDGSVAGKLTDTARAFITLHELNMQNLAEAKFAIKFIQYDAHYFNDIVQEEPLGWSVDDLGFLIELNMLYWGLMALTTMYPSFPSPSKSIICPDCFKFFHTKPKFCNQCGTKF